MGVEPIHNDNDSDIVVVPCKQIFRAVHMVRL